MRALAILGSAAATTVLICSGLGSPELIEIDDETDEPRRVAAVADTGEDVWAAIPAPLDPDRAPARPSAMPDDDRTRFVIFGGSWCPACNAAIHEDVALAERFRDRIEVAHALRGEGDEVFMRSTMARWLSGVTVWTESSSASLAQRCQIRAVPSACLVEGERVIWSGGAGDGQAVLDAHLAGTLDATLARAEIAPSDLTAAVQRGDAEARARIVAALHGFSSRENEIAWDLVEPESATPNELALAIPLARDATNSTSGLNSAILDTYALGLWRNGEREHAARVAERVIAVCDAIRGPCSEERQRAEEFIAAVANDP